MNRERINTLENKSINKALIELAFPSIIGMLINAIYNMADTFFIGRLNDPSALGAVTIAFPIMMMVGSIGGMFGIGGGSYLSRLLGQKDYEKANVSNSTSFFTSLIVSIIVSVLMFIFVGPLLKMFGATDTIMPYALSYTKIIIIANSITMLNMTMNNLLRAEGAAKRSMYGFLIGSGINIILDPIFIFVFDLGVAGAAWATIIGKAVSFIYLFSFYAKKKSIAEISLRCFRPNRKIYGEIFKIGLPSFTRQMLASISMGMINSAAMVYGDSVIAGLGLTQRVFSIAFFIVFGFSTGFQPLAGYSWGANNISRFKETLKAGIKGASIIAILFFTVFLLGKNYIVSAFTDVVAVQDFSIRMMNAMLIALPFMGFQIIITTMFQSIGKGKPSMILSMARQGYFLIPLLLILPDLFGLNGIIYAQPIADILTLILTIFMFLRQRREFNGMNGPQDYDKINEPAV